MQKLRLESQPEFLFALERLSSLYRSLLEEFKAFHKSTNKIDDYEVSYGFYRNPSQCEGFERNCTICIFIGKETSALSITMRDLILGALSSYQQVQSISQNKNYKLNSDYEVS